MSQVATFDAEKRAIKSFGINPKFTKNGVPSKLRFDDAGADISSYAIVRDGIFISQEFLFPNHWNQDAITVDIQAHVRGGVILETKREGLVGGTIAVRILAPIEGGFEFLDRTEAGFARKQICVTECQRQCLRVVFEGNINLADHVLLIVKKRSARLRVIGITGRVLKRGVDLIVSDSIAHDIRTIVVSTNNFPAVSR